jgi:hypothetical protein
VANGLPRALWSNLIWDVDEAFRIAFEATYRKTEYKEPTNLPNKGFGFHTQFQWAFDSGYLVGTRVPRWF